MVASCKLKEGQKVLLVSYHAPYKENMGVRIQIFQQFLKFVDDAKFELDCDQVSVSSHSLSFYIRIFNIIFGVCQ